jgi:hypothetical protein
MGGTESVLDGGRLRLGTRFSNRRGFRKTPILNHRDLQTD